MVAPHADADEARDAALADGLRREGWAVVPDYWAAERWRGLAAEATRMHEHGAFRHAGVGRGASFRVRPDVRGDRVAWIDPARATRRQASWLARMESLRVVLNRTLTLGLFGFEAHLAVYPPGAFYATHLDRFREAAHRRVSTLLYLNEDWGADDGGALRLYLEAADRAPWRDVAPVGGSFACFLSGEFAHEVLPATRERWSVVGWFTARP